MTTLKDIRIKIDKIDGEIVKLLDKRAKLAKQVGERKRKSNMQYFDASRQKSILKRTEKDSDGSFPREGMRNVFTEIISACLNLEQPIKIAYLGPEGTFTHQAGLNKFGVSVSYNTVRNIKDV